MSIRTPYLLVLTVLPFLSCDKPVVGNESGKAATASAADPLTIEADPPLRTYLRTGAVPIVAVGETLTVAARVEVDSGRVTRVGAPVMGRISKLLVQEGELVAEGQTLALLSSTELSEGQLSFIKALSQGQVSRRAVERARVLLKAEVIGSAELQRREAELAESEATRDAGRDQLQLLGMAPEAIQELEQFRRINSISRIVASMRGTVLARRITPGQVVQPADAVFEIADLSSLWLVADVPSAEAGSLFIGQKVEATIGSPPIGSVAGQLSFVSSTVSDSTRTVRVHMNLENARGRYRPSMLSTMRLTGRTQPRACVPVSAIVREDDLDHVFVQTGDQRFALRTVQLGPEAGACRVLLEGNSLAGQIVLDGAFHLNNERRRRALRAAGAE